MLEINFRPETPAERRAALQLMATLAGPEAESSHRTKPWEAGAADPGAPTTAPAGPPNLAEEPIEVPGDDIPYPPFDDGQPSYSRQQLLEALQDYAQVNGAVALKEMLDRFGARRVSDIKPEHYAEVMTIARGEAA